MYIFLEKYVYFESIRYYIIILYFKEIGIFIYKNNFLQIYEGLLK